jgi:hypothetical protein
MQVNYMVPIKLNLQKQNASILSIELCHKFEPTDIVPRVNMAFPKCFGRRQDVLKAIKSQGWSPPNYNILTTLPAKEVDLRADDGQNTSTADTTAMMFPKINIHTGSASFCLDKIIKEEKRMKGEKGSLKQSRDNSRQSCRK